MKGGCINLTPKCFEYLALLTNLTEIELPPCATKESLQLLTNLVNLDIIYHSRAENLSKEDVKEFVKTFPHYVNINC